MMTSERKTYILDLLKQDGRIVAKDVSRNLELSEDTIRRDLRELAADGLLQRVHGGALPASRAVADLAVRRTVSTSGKEAIAQAAARMIRHGQIVFLDGGTTTLALAKAIPPDLKATVITHSPDIAVALRNNPWIATELIGGRIYKHSNVTTGATAIESISGIRCDLFFMGVTGVHAEHGLTTGDREEAAVKRAISRRSAETIVLASQEKIGAVSAYGILELSDIDGLIVAKATNHADIAPFIALGLSVTQA